MAIGASVGERRRWRRGLLIVELDMGKYGPRGGVCGYISLCSGPSRSSPNVFNRRSKFQDTTADDDEGGGGPRWSLHCTVVLPHPFQTIFPFTHDYQGSVFFNVDCAVIYRYDVERGVVERVVDMLEEMTYFNCSTHKLYRRPGDWKLRTIQYSESLVSVQAN